MIIADDLGFYDVSFHNKGKGPLTPNIDKLASEGTRLNNYYVQPLCTPTRSALMTARHPIRDGLQHGVIMAGQAKALPLNKNVKILPEHFKNCGYKTHLVGKWHLGHFRKDYWPTERGFDTFSGYLTGAEDYFTRIQCYGNWGKTSIHKPGPCGLDYRENQRPAATDEDIAGVYSTHLFSDKIEKIVENHDFDEKPIFLNYALQSVHYPVQVPKNYTDQHSWVDDEMRRDYFGMVSAMDESVGRVVKMFEDRGELENTIVVFSSDNGGLHDSGGYNWPFRGEKYTVWEGGVRSIGFVRGPGVEKGGVRKDLFHVVDWLPTLLGMADCDNSDFGGYKTGNEVDNGEEMNEKTDEKMKTSETIEKLEKIENLRDYNAPDPYKSPETRDFDGLDQTNLFHDKSLQKTSKNFKFNKNRAETRKEVLLNIDPIQRSKFRDTRPWISTNFDIKSTAALIYGPWKIITGKPKSNERYVPPEFHQLRIRPSFKHILSKEFRTEIPRESIKMIQRKKMRNDFQKRVRIMKTVWLFNIEIDPTESEELSDRYPGIVNFMLGRLEKYGAVQVPPQNSPGFIWKANPELHGGYWDSWY